MSDFTRVIDPTGHFACLGIGSNIQPETYIPLGLQALSAVFGELAVSSTYLTPAVGFSGPDFCNLVVSIETGLELEELVRTLRAIETDFGRQDFSNKFSSRTLDIDLLVFDDYRGTFTGVTLPRPEIFYNAHVLCPFAELVPDLLLPGETENLAALWQNFDKSQQDIRRVCFDSDFRQNQDPCLQLKDATRC